MPWFTNTAKNLQVISTIYAGFLQKMIYYFHFGIENHYFVLFYFELSYF